MKKNWFIVRQINFIGFLLLCSLISVGQESEKEFAFFMELSTEKNTNYAPDEIISQKAIARRLREGIRPENMIDYTDYPIDQKVIQSLQADTSITYRYSLKWANAVVISSKNSYLDTLIYKFPFAKKMIYVGTVVPSKGGLHAQNQDFFDFIKNPSLEFSGKESEYGQSFNQVAQINMHKIHQMGYKGNGVHLAVFDAGFSNAHKIPAFMNQKAMRKIQIGADLVDLDYTLTDTDNHGTMCLSCIAGFDYGTYIGTAPLVNAYLFRTEYANTEFPIEELNWWKAAEICDSLGIDIISSSLGYTQHDEEGMGYTHQDLDGKTSFIAKAAKFASDKGILVVNSAGNSGSGKWRKIGTPADVKEVLVVGAVDKNGNAARFTSQGNNAIGVPKPDVAAWGVQTYVASSSGSYYFSNGTSFSTPLLAGGMACLREAFPMVTNSDLKNAVKFTSSNLNQHDSILGHGIADFEAAYNLLKAQNTDTSSEFLIISNDRLLVYHPSISEFRYEVKQSRKFLFVRYSKKISNNKVITSTNITQIQIKSRKYNQNKASTINFYDSNGKMVKSQLIKI